MSGTALQPYLKGAGPLQAELPLSQQVSHTSECVRVHSDQKLYSVSIILLRSAMHRFTLGSALLLFLALCLSAKADTVFNLTNGTFQSGATIGGTIHINTTTGQFVSANLMYQLGSMTSVFTGPFANWGETFDSTQFFGDIYDPVGDLFVIDLPVSWIVNYKGGPICSNAALCDDYFGYYQSVSGDVDPSASGLLVPAVATPEPSSLLLLATGVTSTVAFRRRSKLEPEPSAGSSPTSF